MLFDVYATRDSHPVNPGDRVNMVLVAPAVEAEDGSAAISSSLNGADLGKLKLGGLVAIPSDGYTHKLVSITLTDPPTETPAA